jgi:hypothetical protein
MWRDSGFLALHLTAGQAGAWLLVSPASISGIGEVSHEPRFENNDYHTTNRSR